MPEFERTTVNEVKRLPERATYNRAAIYQIIDEALICHVGFVQDGQPFVIPTNHARQDDTLLLHGAGASRLVRHIRDGHPVCVAFTLVDGLVLARSVCHHSLNYRSAIVFGRGQIVEEEEAKLQALELLTEQVAPGRWQDARQPTRQELRSTAVVSIAIESASAKGRSGPPADDEQDQELPIWAGVLPLQLQALAPIPDPTLSASVPFPAYLGSYGR
jgi:nitroimidazol reductase NimA-like FMN-containing flavoprotein (pyridoxamine 5'-phosphate oxidase superfamily)